MKKITPGIFILLTLLFGGGCSPVPGTGFWGQQATLRPGWQQVKSAAVSAATDPMTWVPAAGAAIFSFGDLDESTADWADKHRPIFGRDASNESDSLRAAMTAAYVITALAAPSGDTPGEWSGNKAKGFAVGLVAMGANDWLTLGLKDLTSRQRPNNRDDKSFPSGHASQSTSRAALAAKNLDYIDLPDWGRTTLKTTFYGIAAGASWARVEANQHYPSDVLAGFALGHFIGAFVSEAFLNAPATGDASVILEPAPSGLGLTLSFAF